MTYEYGPVIQVIQRIGLVLFVYHDMLAGVMIGARKFDTELALSVARFDETHRDIGATLEQPGGQLAMARRHHDFEAQAVIIGELARQFVLETHQFAAIDEIRGRVVAQQHA